MFNYKKKAILSFALTAHTIRKKVLAIGTGKCENYPNVMEDWAFGTIKKD